MICPFWQFAGLVLYRYCQWSRCPLGNPDLTHGPEAPLTNLKQTFQACHLCTFNVATIFFSGPSLHIVYYHTPWLVQRRKQLFCALVPVPDCPSTGSVATVYNFPPYKSRWQSALTNRFRKQLLLCIVFALSQLGPFYPIFYVSLVLLNFFVQHMAWHAVKFFC